MPRREARAHPRAAEPRLRTRRPCEACRAFPRHAERPPSRSCARNSSRAPAKSPTSSRACASSARRTPNIGGGSASSSAILRARAAWNSAASPSRLASATRPRNHASRPASLEAGRIGHLLDRCERALDRREIARPQAALDLGGREPRDDLRLASALRERLRLLARAAVEVGVLGVPGVADPDDQPAAEAMRRDVRVVVQRLQQRIDVLRELALLARLRVPHDETAGRELGIDVGVELEQRHDPRDAFVDERVARLQHQHAAQHPGVRDRAIRRDSRRRSNRRAMRTRSRRARRTGDSFACNDR